MALRLQLRTGLLQHEYLKSEAQVVKFYVPQSAGHVSVAKNQANIAFYKAMALAVAIHVMAFSLLMPVVDFQPEKQVAPILVNLINAPLPEPLAVPEPEVEPAPPPIIKKQKPQPRVIKPATQPKAQESTPPAKVAAPEPTSVQEPAPQQVAESAETVEKTSQPDVLETKDEPKPEPKVEPPKFGAAYLNNPAPSYPVLSRRMGEEGRVVLRVLVTTHGEAGNVQIETGSGSERLDQAALESVKKWRFIPAKQNNQPVSAYVLVPVKFSLNS